MNRPNATLTLPEILNLSNEELESREIFPRPRSMPPPAPPPKRLDPREATKLAKFQDDARTRERRKKEKSLLNGLLGAKTLREVARVAGVSRSETWRVLHGITEPRMDTFLRLQLAIGVTGRELYQYLKAAWKRQGYER